MNKKIIISIILLIIIFAAAAKFSSKKPVLTEEKTIAPQSVSVQAASDSKVLTNVVEYPASVVGDQEIKVTAKSAGTVSNIQHNIGDKISAGTLLARVDDTGTLEVGDQGFRNLQIQQSQLAVVEAKKAYSIAKDVYDSTKKSDLSTGPQKDAAKGQVAIAKLQYENARLSLGGSVDNHLIISPIAGSITNRAVTNGDSVNIGQEIATISQSNKVKVQFFVDQKQRDALKNGQEISATDTNGNSIKLLVKNISIQADPATKRFLIEAYPGTTGALLSGTVLTVATSAQNIPQKTGNLILPLSAVNVGQNESYIFISQNGVAKKIVVTVANVSGEAAEISTDISPDTLIIIDGSKLVTDGQAIVIKQ
jgi:RND family efflux transporter MFP subunit